LVETAVREKTGGRRWEQFQWGVPEQKNPCCSKLPLWTWNDPIKKYTKKKEPEAQKGKRPLTTKVGLTVDPWCTRTQGKVETLHVGREKMGQKVVGGPDESICCGKKGVKERTVGGTKGLRNGGLEETPSKRKTRVRHHQKRKNALFKKRNATGRGVQPSLKGQKKN